MTTSDNTQQAINFTNLAKEGLTIVDARGRTVVPASYKNDINKLSSVLPENHPAINSYDGDFKRIKRYDKNNVNISKNSIPIFSNTTNEQLEQKTIQKYQTTEKNVADINDMQEIYRALLNNDYLAGYSDTTSALTAYFRNNSNLGLVISNDANFQSVNDLKEPVTQEELNSKNEVTIGDETFYSNNYLKNSNNNNINKLFKENFKSEFGEPIDTSSNIGKLNNTLMGGDNSESDSKEIKEYTEYNERTFQTSLDWQSSHLVIQGRIEKANLNDNDKITYVSTAEQLITALLKDASMDGDNLTSDANIMLLNDIDLDDMLGDNMKNFIAEEIKSILKNDTNIGDQYETTWNTLEDATTGNKQNIDNSNSNPNSARSKINNALSGDNATKTSQSGIRADVLKSIWNKYFSDYSTDKFNENFTNWIQIDNFTGSIGGGGFAINNLKMAAKGNQHASMFGTLKDATLHGVWMENANVIAYSNGNNTNRAAILAQHVEGNSTTIISVQGDGITTDDEEYIRDLDANNEGTLLKDDEKNMFNGEDGNGNAINRFVGLVAEDIRNANNLENAYGYGGISGLNDNFKVSSNGGIYYNTGWTYNMGSNSVHARGGFFGIGNEQRYEVVSNAIRANNESESGIILSSNSNVDMSENAKHKAINGTTDVRKVTTTQDKVTVDAYLALLCAAQAASGKEIDTGKIRLYQINTETVKTNDVIKDWDADINWDEWEEFQDNGDGTVNLIKKHGDETQEYLDTMALIEFYEQQGVNVEYTVDKDSGFLTYSASGYAVDMQYKDEIEKYYSDDYLYKVDNTPSSLVIFQREQVKDLDTTQILFVDDFDSLLDKNLKNGVWFIEGASIKDSNNFERKSLDEVGITESNDEYADELAQAEYDRTIREIEIQEEKIDAQITELENNLKAIEQEIENQQTIIKQNIQSGFSTFAS